MDEILVGVAVIVVAGLITGLVVKLQKQHAEKRDSNVVYRWLQQNTADELGEEFKSTHVISSYTNLTEDRVSSICHKDSRIFLSTDEPDLWSIHRRQGRSIYEKRGLIEL